jgi:4-alpha-glucanotransferase
MQDVFGSRERINVPGTVSPTNWTYRLPWRSERLDEEPSVRERRDRLRAWAVQYGRA